MRGMYFTEPGVFGKISIGQKWPKMTFKQRF